MVKLALCAVIVAVTGTVSVVAGWAPIWYVTEAVWRRSSLVETPATISEVELKTRKGSSSSRSLRYSVAARYHYRWEGVDYTGTQVTWLDVRSSAEDHNTSLFRVLRDAREARSTVPAWTDPRNPAYAVLDKSVPWGALVFAVPVGLIFGAIALLFGYAFILMLRSLRGAR